MSGEIFRKLCFGNFSPNPACRACEQTSLCKDDQAGWGISTLEEDLVGTLEIERVSGPVPDWVYEWDQLPQEEIEKLKIEDPDKYKRYCFLNSGIMD